jgi:hypothetical protein
MFWLSAAKWIGTGAGVPGAIVIALDPWDRGVWISRCSCCRLSYGVPSR